MEPITKTREIKGKNQLLDILLEELNVKEVSLVDNQGRITKSYDGEKTIEYQYSI